MNLIIGFFRDVLDGPLYIIVTVICVILICSCIGYLAEQSLNKKKQKQEYEETHATVSSEETPQQQVNTQSVNQTTNNTNSTNVIDQNMINESAPTNQTLQNNTIQQPQTVPTVDVVQEIGQASNPVEQLNSQVSSEISQLSPPITDFSTQPVPNTIEMSTEQISQQPTISEIGEVSQIPQQSQVPSQDMGFVQSPPPTMVQTPNNQ